MIKYNLANLEQQNFGFFYISIKAKNKKYKKIKKEFLYTLKENPFGAFCFFFVKKKLNIQK